MNEVECRLAPFKIACDGFGVRKIRLPDLHSGILSPFAALQLRRRADETANGIAGIEQPRSETSANVTGGSGNRDTLWIRAFRQLLGPTFSKVRIRIASSSAAGSRRNPALGLLRRVDCMWHRPSGAIARESKDIPGLDRLRAHMCNPARAQ
jgi:hypothetical protein